MLKWLIRSRLAAFQRDYDYDMTYAREILDVDVGAFLKFAKATGMGKYRKGVPKEVWVAAGLVATMLEDCGPCTQLGVVMAERDGVDRTQLRAIVAGDEAAMTDDVRLGVRFARASLAHAAAADELRDEIVRRWGKKAPTSCSTSRPDHSLA